MIIIEQYRKDDPQVWWHRPVIWIHKRIAPGYALVLIRENVGLMYFDDEPSIGLIDHEAEHVYQSLKTGPITFRIAWIIARWFRMIAETEGYAHQTKTPEECLSELESRASVYWLGTLSDFDRRLILFAARLAQERGPRQYRFVDKRTKA